MKQANPVAADAYTISVERTGCREMRETQSELEVQSH